MIIFCLFTVSFRGIYPEVYLKVRKAGKFAEMRCMQGANPPKYFRIARVTAVADAAFQ